MNRTMRILFTAAVLGAVCIVPISTAQEKAAEGLKAKVVGLSIARKDPRPEPGGSLAYGLPTGVAVHFLVETKGKCFIRFDQRASKLAVLSDDKGNNLKGPERKTKGGDLRPVWGWLSVWRSPQQLKGPRDRARFRIASKSLPAADAKGIKVKANLLAVIGSDEKTQELKGVRLRRRTALKLGTIDAKIQFVTVYGNSRNVQFTASKTFDEIKEIAFLDARGKLIKSYEGGSTWSERADGSVSYARQYNVQTTRSAVTLKVIYFERVEKVGVPIEADVGLGL